MTPLYISENGYYCLGDDYILYDRIGERWRVLIEKCQVTQNTVDDIRSGHWAGMEMD